LRRKVALLQNCSYGRPQWKGRSEHPQDDRLVFVNQREKGETHLQDRRRYPNGSSIGPYRLLQKPGHEGETLITQLGDGATSLVFLVEQKLAGEKTIHRALKIFAPENELKDKREARGDSYGKGQFLSEIEAISSITHQNVVSVIDAGYDHEQRPYFVMELVAGDDLRTLLKVPPNNKWHERAKEYPYLVIRIAQQICWALVYLHSNNRYHFDIAPKNIFIRQFASTKIPRPHVIVGDLGVSRHVPPLEQAAESNETVSVYGTREYTPEVLEPYRSKKPIPIAELAKYAAYWDLFALGKVILEIVQAWGLVEEPRLKALQIVADRLTKHPTTAENAAEALERLLPAHVTTAGVEELSSDALGGRKYITIPLYSVPVSKRVRDVLDHPLLMRLQSVPQLLLYRSTTPGGVHTSFEHVLGSYAVLLRCLGKLLSGDRFRAAFWQKELEEAQVVILLSRLASFPLDRILYDVSPLAEGEKEVQLLDLLNTEKHGASKLKTVIADGFRQCDLNSVLAITCHPIDALSPEQKIIASLFRSSIDTRVMDYLSRDSHHTGIPSGTGLDIGTIIDNLFWSEENDQIGVTRDAIFPVEHLLSARYWMFARLYWSQYNRSTAAMLRHVLHTVVRESIVSRKFLASVLSDQDEPGALKALQDLWKHTGAYTGEDSGIVDLLQRARPQPFPTLLDLFSKNWIGDDYEASRAAIRAAEELDSAGLEALGAEFVQNCSHTHSLSSSDILFDIPREHPRKLGEDLFVQIEEGKERRLHEISDFAASLPDAFLDTVVRLRCFIHPRLSSNEKMISDLRAEAKEFLTRKFVQPSS
jgi:HD superfamily phosphohydrolase